MKKNKKRSLFMKHRVYVYCSEY